jgi:colicin import membrane protein
MRAKNIGIPIAILAMIFIVEDPVLGQDSSDKNSEASRGETKVSSDAINRSLPSYGTNLDNIIKKAEARIKQIDSRLKDKERESIVADKKKAESDRKAEEARIKAEAKAKKAEELARAEAARQAKKTEKLAKSEAARQAKKTEKLAKSKAVNHGEEIGLVKNTKDAVVAEPVRKGGLLFQSESESDMKKRADVLMAKAKARQMAREQPADANDLKE